MVEVWKSRTSVETTLESLLGWLTPYTNIGITGNWGIASNVTNNIYKDYIAVVPNE
jgi:hypothetical protein